jgi:hypothetical protein
VNEKTDALARARRASRALDRAGEVRDDAIREAKEAGASLREIAVATRLSKARVGQIARDS